MAEKLRFPERLNAERFLAEYWQRKPLLFRQALPGFDCGLQPDELAGLVDKHLPEVARLLDHFRFLPDWRLDDVMVSYAADQGSVGPHIDDYDVFLYQAQGRRRWKIHYQPVSEEDFIPDLDLRILPEFQAEEEWLLEPGDMLYLPPNLAHWGVAEGECMTCSVGFRAPSYRELASAWCDELIEHRITPGRYRDPTLQPQAASAEIRPEALVEIQNRLHRFLAQDPEQQRRWFGRFITDTKQNLQVVAIHPPLKPLDFLNRYRQQRLIQRNSYSRLAFSRGLEGSDSLFANGSEYLIPSEEGGFLPVITHYRELHFGYLEEWLQQPDYLQLVCDLYNDGHFEFPHE
jgi:50S ribosomal protein L16 3-hydroxylase